MMFTKFLAAVALAAVSLASPAAAGTAIDGQAATDAQVTVPPATLLSYAGTYRTDRGMEATIAMGLDGSLTIQLNSEPLRMRPLSQTEFAVDEKRARVSFQAAGGKVSGLTVRQGSRELHASRVD